MKPSTLRQMNSLFTISFTALTLLLAALLIFQCASIYIEGTSQANFINGVRINDIYSRDIVASRLSIVAWVAVLWLAAGIGAAVLRSMNMPKNAQHLANKDLAFIMRAEPRAVKGSLKLRIALCLAAILLIVIGIINGGMRDVLVKAINICTECIGLG